MNGPVQTAQQLTRTAMPVELEILAPPPLLLPGESPERSPERHQVRRQAIFADLAPRSAIEWLLDRYRRTVLGDPTLSLVTPQAS